MKVNGEWEELRDKANSLTFKEKFIMENGLMTKLMDLVYIFILIKRCMKAIGKTIFKKVKELKSGLMDPFFKGNINKVKRMGLDYILGLMELLIKVNGKIMKSMDMEFISGVIKGSIVEVGKEM